MYFKALKIMTIWVAALVAIACIMIAVSATTPDKANDLDHAAATTSKKLSHNYVQLGDLVGLDTALKGQKTNNKAGDDLTPAAGEHKKYILVKKKPKHKKIKMDVYEPKMKYKKIKMKVPVKKMKKKKVKGYLVKKEHGHYS